MEAAKLEQNGGLAAYFAQEFPETVAVSGEIITQQEAPEESNEPSKGANGLAAGAAALICWGANWHPAIQLGDEIKTAFADKLAPVVNKYFDVLPEELKFLAEDFQDEIALGVFVAATAAECIKQVKAYNKEQAEAAERDSAPPVVGMVQSVGETVH